MTNLTEKWKKGKLENGTYYVRLKHDSSTIDVYDCGVWWNNAWHEITEVLAEVPSFEQWIMTKNLSERAHLEMYKARGKKVKLEKENTKLKELLKECRENIAAIDYDSSVLDREQSILLNKINQVLGEE